MPTPSRIPPRAGAPVRIAHFGGSFEPATLLAVEEQGRRLIVRAHDGELLEFVLSPATARFVQAGSPHGARLELLEER